jgi:hypothetical protein
MRGFSQKIFMVGTAVVAVAASVLSDVSAQKTTPAADEVGIGSSGDSAFGDEKMTREQKVAWVEQQVGSAQSVYTRVESMLEQAKKEKDSIKISCLQDKLTQLEVNLQGVEERRMLFEDANSRGDTADSDQQFRMLQIYISRVQSLMAEAENCIGEGDVVIGESDTTLTINQDITNEDPTEPIDWQVGINQPVHASGYY